MSDFQYTYKQLYGNKSQCEVCHHDTCQDKGKRSWYDGEKHICSRFQAHTRERQEEIDKEEHDRAFEDYWQNFSLGPIVIGGLAEEKGILFYFVGGERIDIDVDVGDNADVINQKLCQKLRYCN